VTLNSIYDLGTRLMLPVAPRQFRVCRRHTVSRLLIKGSDRIPGTSSDPDASIPLLRTRSAVLWAGDCVRPQLPSTRLIVLNATVMSVARTRITLDMQDRQDAHRTALANLKAGYSARGTLTSSFAQAVLDEAIGAEYRIRAQLVWQGLARALSGERLSGEPVIGAQLKETVAEFIRTQCKDLERDHAFLLGLTRDSANMRSIEYWRERAYDRAVSDIDLALLSACRVETGGGPTIHIYQPCGIVQTGVGANATWTQYLGASERDAAQRALDAVKKALQGSAETPNAEMAPVLEVVADAKSELSREQPNVPRLQGAFMTIATTLQALGSAAPAYQLLKGAAALFGVTLP
jgi:hypothetical protein